MSRSFTREFIEEVKNKVNILDIAAKYTQVESSGSNYLALCPFHSESNPSMQLNPEENTFYCHSCGAGSRNHESVTSSDVVSFVVHAGNLSFPQAVEVLANYAGVALPDLSPEEMKKQNEKKEKSKEMMKTAEVFHFSLEEDKAALNYLYNRGITNEDIVKWKLGYGGDYNLEELANVRGRIAFPLFDFDGNIVSFTGRVPYSSSVLDKLNEEAKEKGRGFIPKYRDKKGVDKNNHLYGIHIAKDFIRSTRFAIIVEGWTDVISLHRRGVNQAVSTMGVALSKEQINLLRRAGAQKVIIMRDGDSSGFASTERNAKVLKENGLDCYVYALSDGIDPDSLCLSYNEEGKSLLDFILEGTQTINQFKLSRVYKDTEEEILHYYQQLNQAQESRLGKITEVLVEVEDPVELDIYIRQLSQLLNISYEAIKEKVLSLHKSYNDTQENSAFQNSSSGMAQENEVLAFQPEAYAT